MIMSRRLRLHAFALAALLLFAGSSVARSATDSVATAPARAGDLTDSPRILPNPFTAAPRGVASLAVGLVATVAPAGVAALAIPSGGTRDAAILTGALAGVVVGPAVGLQHAGRGDLASRGLVLRAIGVGITAGAGLVLVSMTTADSPASGSIIPLVTAAALGAVLTSGSCLHDLAITPSVTVARPGRSAGRTVAHPAGIGAALTMRF
jgi:hypothetical protein